MHSTMKRYSVLAALGGMIIAATGAPASAVSVAPGMLKVSEDIVRRFDAELRANPSDSFQIFQLYLVTNPRAATALTAKFMRGREDLAPSIGAAAAVALSGSFATNETISVQIQGIAQVIGHLSPGSASDTFSTMTAAVPQYNLFIVAGLSRGAPSMASALNSTGDSPQLASTDLNSSDSLNGSDPNINYSDGEPLVETLFAVEGATNDGGIVTVSDSQTNICMSAPCI